VQEVTTRTALISLDTAGILSIKMLNGIILDYEDALDNFLVIKNLTKDQPVLRLTDFRGKFRIKKKAREFIRSKEVKGKTIARAVLVNNATEIFLYKVYFFFAGTSGRTKVFKSYQDANKWLLSQK
jgi:hypothetical protein